MVPELGERFGNEGSETFDFGTGVDPLNFTSATPDLPDTFLLQLDGAGNTTWARQVSGAGTVAYARLTVGASGSIYTAGSFDGTADFVGTGKSLASTAGQDAYIARWNTDGTLLWVRQFSGSSAVNAQNLVADSDDNVYMAGRFLGTADFDPDAAGTFNLTGNGPNEPFRQGTKPTRNISPDS